LHTSALEIAKGRLEELRATAYKPPVVPYCASNTIASTNVVFSQTASGAGLVLGVMRTVIAPVAKGHMVTVTVTTTNLAQPISAELQTLINNKSGGQP
jgi:phage tail sheath gpL-like